MRRHHIAGFLLFSCAAWAQCIDTDFVGSMISSGRNRPSIRITKDLLNLCALLHRGVPREAIRGCLNVSDDELERKLEALRREGLARADSSGRTVPTAVVITHEDARKFFDPEDRMVESAARLLLRKLPEVKSECGKIQSFAGQPFEAISFFVVSDVLLDNWQISNVERLFVRSERTERTGGRYYFTILENPPGQTAEPFGIYGNTGSQWGALQIGLYGNDRFSGHTLLSIPEAEFNARFGFDPSLAVKDARGQLAERLVEALRGKSGSITAAQRNALSELGMIDDRGKLNALLIEGEDYKALDRVAAIVTTDLVDFLEQQRETIQARYGASPYRDETSFSEYFMWWYHFFYTAVTNRLRDKHAIRIPKSGTITYFVVP